MATATYLTLDNTARQLSDAEKRELALSLGSTLTDAPSPYAAPERIAATTALMIGDYKSAISLMGVRPTTAPGGEPPKESVLAWWDLAFDLACMLEDAADA